MPDASTSGPPVYSPWLAQGIGYVVLEASACEDQLGELIALHRGEGYVADLDWSESGKQLANAVASLPDGDAAGIADAYRRLIDLRNTLVHGLWLENAEGAGQHLNMKRLRSTKRDPKLPSYQFTRGWGEESLASLAEEFRTVSMRGSKAVSRYMGLA